MRCQASFYLRQGKLQDGPIPWGSTGAASSPTGRINIARKWSQCKEDTKSGEGDAKTKKITLDTIDPSKTTVIGAELVVNSKAVRIGWHILKIPGN